MSCKSPAFPLALLLPPTRGQRKGKGPRRNCRLAQVVGERSALCCLFGSSHKSRSGTGRIRPSPRRSRSGPESTRSTFFSSRRPSAHLAHYDFLLFNPVPQVSSRVPDGLIGLHMAFFIRGPHRHRVTRRYFRRPHHLPRSERISPVILAEPRLPPRFRPVLRGFYFDYLPIAAEGNSLQGDAYPRWNFGATIGRNQKGSHWHPRDQNGPNPTRFHFLRRGVTARGVGNAIPALHPEVFVRRTKNTNPSQALHPIGCEIPGHHQPQRESIQHWKRFTVHEVCHNRFVQGRIGKFQRFEENVRAGAFRSLACLESLKLHLNRSLLDPRGIQQFAQPNAGPHRIAHRSVAPLPAGYTRLEPASRVPRALVHRSHRDRFEFLREIAEAQRLWLVDVAFDF